MPNVWLSMPVKQRPVRKSSVKASFFDEGMAGFFLEYQLVAWLDKHKGDRMKVTYQYRGATLWVQLEGELDHHTAVKCRRQLDEVLVSHPQIRQMRINLSELHFMDSSGIGVLIGRYKIMKERRGIMTLYGLKPAISRIVEMAGLAQIMNVE